MSTHDRWVSGAWRALRTFLQAFLATILAGPLRLIDASALRSAAIAGIAALLALIMRWLDDTEFRSLPPG